MGSLLDLDKLHDSSNDPKYAALTDNEIYTIRRLSKPDRFKTIDDHHTHTNKLNQMVYEWWIIARNGENDPSHAYVVFSETDHTVYLRKSELAKELVEEYRQEYRRITEASS